MFSECICCSNVVGFSGTGPLGLKYIRLAIKHWAVDPIFRLYFSVMLFYTSSPWRLKKIERNFWNSYKYSKWGTVTLLI